MGEDSGIEDPLGLFGKYKMLVWSVEKRGPKPGVRMGVYPHPTWTPVPVQVPHGSVF